MTAPPNSSRLRPLILALAVLCALIASSCTSDPDIEETANYVAVDASPTDAAADTTAGEGDTGSNTAGDTTTFEPATEASTQPLNEVTEIEQLFEKFLELRAAVIVGDADATTMSAVTTSNGLTQVQSLRDANDARRRNEMVSTVTALAEWPNITSIEKRGERIIFTDCTERQQINDLGTVDLLFVTQQVTITAENGTQKIDRVDVVQDGVVAATASEFGCIPASFAKRAHTVAEQAVATVADLAANPSSALDAELPAVFADPARTELAEALTQLESAGMRQEPTDQVRFDVLGLDVHEPGVTAVVAVCRLFPDGRALVDQQTGVSGTADLEPGASEEERIFIRLESVGADAGPIDVVTHTELGNTNCWKG